MPRDWRVSRIGDVCDVSGGSTPSKTKASYWDGSIPFVTPTDVTGLTDSNYLESTESSITKEGLRSCSTRLLPPGTVLLTSRATIGICAVNSVPVATNQGFANMVCGNQIHNIYLLYLLRSKTARLISLSSGSTFRELSRRSLRNLRILLPPIVEQRRIAEILSTVDGAIQNADAIISKTQELKRGLMQRLLTRGIGHTRFKQTEVGEIPEEWEAVRGHELFTLVGGYAPSAIKFGSKMPDSTLYIKVDDMNHVQNQRLITTSEHMFSRLENPNIVTCPEGVIIFPKRGAAILGNKVRILGRESTFDPNVMGLICNPTINSAFFRYQLEHLGLYHLLENAGIPQLNNKHLYPFMFKRPPIEEQHEIASVIECVADRLSTEIERKASLEDLRKGLMQVLLTGKVRVRT